MEAKNIVLKEGRSHTVILGGREIRFDLERPMTGVTDEALIAYCQRQPKGRFIITDAPKPEGESGPKKKAAKVEKEPEPEEDEEEGEDEEPAPKSAPSRKRSGSKQKKVKLT